MKRRVFNKPIDREEKKQKLTRNNVIVDNDEDKKENIPFFFRFEFLIQPHNRTLYDSNARFNFLQKESPTNSLVKFEKEGLIYMIEEHWNAFKLIIKTDSESKFEKELFEKIPDKNQREEMIFMDNVFHLHKGFELNEGNFRNYLVLNEENDDSKKSWEEIDMNKKHVFIKNKFIYKKDQYPINQNDETCQIKFHGDWKKLITFQDTKIEYHEIQEESSVSFLNRNISYYQFNLIYKDFKTGKNFGFVIFCKTQFSLIHELIKINLNTDLIENLIKYFFLTNFILKWEEGRQVEKVSNLKEKKENYQIMKNFFINKLI